VTLSAIGVALSFQPPWPLIKEQRASLLKPPVTVLFFIASANQPDRRIAK